MNTASLIEQSEWEQRVQADRTKCAQSLIKHCTTRVIDSCETLYQVATTIALVEELDIEQYTIGLLDQFMSNVVPGLGWLEYYQDVIADSLDDCPKSRQALFRQLVDYDDTNPRLGALLLAILRPDNRHSIDAQIAHTIPAVFADSGVNLVTSAIVHVCDPSILNRVMATCHVNYRQDVFEKMIVYAISRRSPDAIRMLIPLCDQYHLRTRAQESVFQALVSIWAPPSSDESSELSTAAALAMFPVEIQTGQIVSGNMISAFYGGINAILSDPNASNFLISTVRMLPNTTRKNLRRLILHRWAIKDAGVLFAAMTHYSIDREQLEAWYHDHEQYVAAAVPDDDADQYSLIASRDQLDLNWLDTLRQAKSARF